MFQGFLSGTLFCSSLVMSLGKFITFTFFCFLWLFDLLISSYVLFSFFAIFFIIIIVLFCFLYFSCMFILDSGYILRVRVVFFGRLFSLRVPLSAQEYQCMDTDKLLGQQSKNCIVPEHHIQGE